MEDQYALLPDRIKAVVVDSVLVIIAMYAVSEILNGFDNVPNYVRIVIAVFLLFLYDPIFTSLYGGTIGHSYSKIKVKRDSDSTRNISFPMAIVRFLIKATLGWLSLLTVTSAEKRKAIHDLEAKSVVLKE
ncbi:MAG: RDD family protein [Bacteroidota bacterium]